MALYLLTLSSPLPESMTKYLTLKVCVHQTTLQATERPLTHTASSRPLLSLGPSFLTVRGLSLFSSGYVSSGEAGGVSPLCMSLSSRDSCPQCKVRGKGLKVVHTPQALVRLTHSSSCNKTVAWATA